MSGSPRKTLAGALLILMPIVVYYPATQGDFIWDDDDYVWDNPLVTGETGYLDIWFSRKHPSQYFPLVYTTYRVEHQLFGLEPFVYHVNNIILHALSALMLWIILARLRVPGAYFAAAIFALHPVNVESVAWITERKNTLMAFFMMGSFIAWWAFVRRSRAKRNPWPFYALSLVLYVLALFSKSLACTLPAALVLSLWIRHVPVDRKRWLQIAPYALLGLGAGLLSIWWEHDLHGKNPLAMESLDPMRILIASRALWFYLGKIVWPIDLTFSYPRWVFDGNTTGQYVWLAACALLAIGMWVYRRRFGRGPIAAIVIFAAMLVPMIGLISQYAFFFTFVADHYQYMAMIGPVALFAAGIAKIRQHALPIQIIVLAALGWLTWRQCGIYQNQITLWQDTIAKNPQSWMAHNNLGAYLFNQGEIQQALFHYEKAVAISPMFPKPNYNLAVALAAKGQHARAVEHFTRTLTVTPDDVLALTAMGNALHALKRYPEAEQHHLQAIRLRPDFAGAYINLGNLLRDQKRLYDAADSYATAISKDSRLIAGYMNLGITLADLGRTAAAVQSFEQARRLLLQDGATQLAQQVQHRMNQLRLAKPAP